jgi:hypothetical protein
MTHDRKLVFHFSTVLRKMLKKKTLEGKNVLYYKYEKFQAKYICTEKL